MMSGLIVRVNPYLLNPLTIIRGYRNGEIAKIVSDVSITFSVDGFWETVSLLHTFKKEQPIIRSILETVGPDDVFWDIGANLGIFACYVSETIPDGSVVAFEPHPANVERLRRNASLNDCPMEIVDVALSDANGSALLAVDSSRVSNQRYALETRTTGASIQVQEATGDRMVAREQLPSPTILKIDVEGAELKVIRGLQQTLRKPSCRLVYCEMHPQLIRNFGGDPSQVTDELTALGFDVSTIHSSGGQSYLLGHKKNS